MRARTERIAALTALGIAAVLIAIAALVWALGHGWMTLILGIVAAVTVLGSIGGLIEASRIERRERREE